MKGKKFAALLLCLCFVFALAACASNAKKIVGRWTMKDDPSVTMEFFSDGTCSGGAGGNSGNYSVDGDRLHLEISYLLDETFTIDIHGDTLTMADDDGNEIEFIRSD